MPCCVSRGDADWYDVGVHNESEQAELALGGSPRKPHGPIWSEEARVRVLVLIDTFIGGGGGAEPPCGCDRGASASRML